MPFSIRYDEDVEIDPCERDRFSRPFRASRDQAIWRFLPLRRALQIIATKSIYLSHFDTFNDKLEGRLPVWTLAYWHAEAARHGWSATEVEQFFDNLKARRSQAFASCWRGDDTLWFEGFERYADQQDELVCIQSRVKALADCLTTALSEFSSDSLHAGLGRVLYLSHDTDRAPIENGFLHLMMKENSFSWEREHRVLLFLERSASLPVTYGDSGEPLGVELPLENLDWIEAVYFMEGSAGATDLASACGRLGIPVKPVPR